MNYIRAYSMLHGLKGFPARNFVRQFFGNAKERQEKRKKILAELKKGYLSDLKEVKATDGKRYLAFSEPFPREESSALPIIQGVTIGGRSVVLPQDTLGSVTLLLLWTREHGQKSCDIYRSTFSENFRTNKNTKYYEVSVIDGWLFSMMRSLINNNLRKQIPSDRQENFLCCYEGKEVVKTLFENTLVGHAVLLDQAGFVRWKAHGPPTDEELSYLVKCTNSLCSEIKD